MIRALALALLMPLAAQADALRLAATTSFRDSGLAGALIPAFEAETGREVDLLIVGSGQALRLGAAGDVDALLTHAPAAEAAFVAAGHARARVPVFASDFVLVGPADDTAGVRGAPDAATALRRIARAEAPFVSRGDDSGTHAAEMRLWEAAGLAPAGRWYRPVGAGMGAALVTAAAMDAYLLSDRGSWLAFGAKGHLALLHEGDPMLANPYAFMAVDPARHPSVDGEGAAALGAWLVSTRARNLVEGFEIGGGRVFTAHGALPSDP